VKSARSFNPSIALDLSAHYWHLAFLTMLALIFLPSAPKPFGSHPFTRANRRVELSLSFSSERNSENAAVRTKRLRASHSATQLFTVFAVSRSR
jgi:hypothetical protein